VSKPYKLVFVFLFALFSFCQFVMAEEQEIRIKLIEIKANNKIDRMTILAKLSLKEGDLFSPERIQEDIKNLYQMGFFDQVSVESEGLEGGIALFFIVHEKPFLVEIVYEGNENMDKDRLDEAVHMRTEIFLDVKKVKRSVKQIKEAYEGDAFYNTSVVPVIQHLSNNQAVVTFLIEEGEQVFIRKIEVEGNQVFKDKEIRKQMETDTYFWLTSWVTESGRYRKEQLSFDRERIKDLYLNNGYLNIDVGAPKATLSEDKEWFDITIPIIEGDQFVIGEIGYEGEAVFDASVLSSITKSKTGDIFNRGKLRQDIGGITEHYGEIGYIDTNIVPDLRPNVEEKKVDIIFRVSEGDPVKIREVHIAGNNKTRDKVIRREIRVNEQETINTKAIRRSFQRLNNLNYFENINLIPKRLSPGWVDLDVEVKEKPTGTFSVGGGFSSVDKFVATVDMTMGNFLGKGQLLKLKAEVGGRRNTYSFTFREPYLFDYDVSGTLNIFNQVRDFGVYDEKRKGGGVVIGKSYGEHVKSSVSYTLETLEVTNLDKASDINGDIIIDPLVPMRVIEQEALGKTLTSSIGFSISRDTRDFFFDPKEGSRHSLSLQYAGTFLGGDNAYYKVIADSRRFFPLLWEHVFSLHGRFGWTDGIDGKDPPYWRAFFCGRH